MHYAAIHVDLFHFREGIVNISSKQYNTAKQAGYGGLMCLPFSIERGILMPKTEYYPSETLVELSREKSSYSLVVRLANQDVDPTKIAAFFKYDTNTNSSLLAANERVTFELAELLGLPITSVKFHTHDNMKGHVSYVVPGDFEIWNNLEIKFVGTFGQNIKGRVRDCFDDVDEFYRMFVFDCWVANHDRHGANFMGTLLPGADKLSLYLIDHGHCILGPMDKWNSMKQNEQQWLDVTVFIREQGVVDLITDFSQLEPYIKQIEAISDEQIDGIVDNIPSDYYTDEQKSYAKQMLKTRRGKLNKMLHDWCTQQGKVKAAI